MNRILVIRGGAIGDFVLTLPALKLLRDAYPRARIEILGYKHIVALGENRFYANATRSIEYGPLAGFFAKNAELPIELRDYFGTFDLVVSYLYDPDRIFEQNIRRCGVEEFLVGSSKITGTEHAARQLSRPMEELGLCSPDPAARLYPSAADRAFAADLHRLLQPPIIAFHPGSGSGQKNWPIDRWIELARWFLTEAHATTLLVIGGEADDRQLAAFRSAGLSEAAVRFVVNLSLPELAAVLEKCRCFLGHDSGISHIAAATGLPCLTLFGLSDPEIWAPQNAGVRVLHAPFGDLAQLDRETVANAFYELMRIGIRT